jgi:hypothetical protein
MFDAVDQNAEQINLDQDHALESILLVHQRQPRWGMCFQHVTNMFLTIYYSGSSSDTLPLRQQAIRTMHELELKKAALELREKDLALKEREIEIKRRELALLERERQLQGN